MALTPKLLSTQTRWESISIVWTATWSTLVHTWPTATTTFQDIFLKIVNTSAAPVTYYIEVWVSWTMTLVAQWTIPISVWSITEKIRLQWNATAPIINIYASTTAVLRVSWEVNEYS